MTEHKIGWLNMPGYKPETWNPIVGCTEKSEGCKECFAKKMAFRLMHMPHTSYYQFVLANNGAEDPEEFRNLPEWNGTTHFVQHMLDKPLRWKEPRMVFVCDMGDLFHETVPFEWIDSVFSVMSDNDQHIYILLTKRPENMLKFWQYKCAEHNIFWQPKHNVWIGVTAENQEQANRRIPVLLQIPAAKHFVSIEPMLGPIDFYEPIVNAEHYHTLKGFGDISGGDFGKFNGPKLDWVICGGESGPKARPMHPDWVRSVRDQCKDAGTPFFFKQWGKYYTHWGNMTTWEDEFKMYTSYQQFTQKVLVKKGDVLVDMDGKHPKNGGDMQTAKYPVAIMNPVSVKCAKLDGRGHYEWPQINREAVEEKQICYKTNEVCKYDCKGLCRESM